MASWFTRGITAMGTLLALAPSMANAVPVALTDLSFSTSEQSQWGPGQTETLEFTNTFKFVDIEIPQKTLSQVTTTSVPNPSWAAWNLKYVAALPGCTVTSPFNIDGCAKSSAGTEPSKTVSVKDGLELDYGGHLETGVNNRMEFTPGNIEADYASSAYLIADKDEVTAGELFSLALLEYAPTIALTSEFSDINYSWNAFIDSAVDVDLTTWVLGDRSDFNNIIYYDTGYEELELFNAEFTNDAITARLLGVEFPSIEEGFEIPIDITLPVPGLVKPALPLYEVGYYTPDLDQSVQGAGNSVTTSVVPIDRNCVALLGCPQSPTDLLKMELDIDVLNAFAGAPLGGAVTTFFGGPRFETNILDYDLGLYAGYQQSLDFTANLTADLMFNKAADVEIAPGVFVTLDSISLGLLETINIVHPGGDFEVTPVYHLADNVFTNKLEENLQFLQTLDFLQIKMTAGALFGSKGFDLKLFAQSLELGNPILNTIADLSFALQGFNSIVGSGLTFSSTGAVLGNESGLPAVSVPEPSTGTLVLFGLAGLVLLRNRRMSALRR